MKLFKMSLCAIALISLTNSSYACISGDGHEHGFMEERTTDELGIFDSIDELISPKIVNKNFGGEEPFLGLPMRYPTYAHPQAESQGALALFHNGAPIVLWGPQVAQMRGRNVMGFIIQHEYAHHDLRHLLRQDVPSAVKEAEADCQATKSIIRYGMGHILPEVVASMQAMGCEYDPRMPISMVQSSHPCGIQRAGIIRQCANM